MVVYAISERELGLPLTESLSTLSTAIVEFLVDVRTVPRSRYNRQFNRETLPAALAEAGIGYLHVPEPGGLRRPRRDLTDTGWRNESFRGYADCMQTPEVDRSLDQLMALASLRRVAIMCAESAPWRCHQSAEKANPHKLTSFARVENGHVTSPAPEGELF